MLFKLKLSSINLSIAIIKHSTRVIAKTDKTNSLFPSLTFIYLKEKQYDTIIIVNEKGTNRIKKYVYLGSMNRNKGYIIRMNIVNLIESTMNSPTQ